MADLISTRRIPGTVWIRAGVSLTGGMDNSLRPVWLYGCVRRWAAGIKGRGVYVLVMVGNEGRCETFWRDDRGRLTPCRRRKAAGSAMCATHVASPGVSGQEDPT
jgi:hypothetical protein